MRKFKLSWLVLLSSLVTIPSGVLVSKQSFTPSLSVKRNVNLTQAQYSFNPLSDTTCEVRLVNKDTCQEAIIPDTDNEQRVVTKVSGFDDAKLLEHVKFSSNVTETGYRSFAGCTKLANVEFNDNLETIGYSSFYQCINLRTIHFNNKLKTIGTEAFRSCTSLTSITLPNSIETIKESTFHNCTSLQFLSFGEGLKAKHIGSNIVYGCSKLKTLVFPTAPLTLDSNAFSYATALEEVRLPEGLTIVPYYAFYGCSSLKTLVLPKSVNRMYHGSLSNTNIQKLYCPWDTIEQTQNVLFDQIFVYDSRPSISFEIDVPNISLIDEYQNILRNSIEPGKTNITYKEGTTPVPAPNLADINFLYDDSNNTYTANEVTNKQTVEVGIIPDYYEAPSKKVNKIADNLFQNSTKLRTITVGRNVNYFGANAFRDCTSLETINFNNTNIDNITFGNNVLTNTNRLTTVNIVNNKTVIDPVTQESLVSKYKAKLVAAGMNENVNVLLTSWSINFKDNQVLGLNDEYVNDIHTLIIPSMHLNHKITNIGANAFANNKNLEEVYLPSTISQIEANAFSNLTNNTRIYLNNTNVNEINTLNISESAFYRDNPGTNVRYLFITPVVDNLQTTMQIFNAYKQKLNNVINPIDVPTVNWTGIKFNETPIKDIDNEIFNNDYQSWSLNDSLVYTTDQFDGSHLEKNQFHFELVDRNGQNVNLPNWLIFNQDTASITKTDHLPLGAKYENTDLHIKATDHNLGLSYISTKSFSIKTNNRNLTVNQKINDFNSIGTNDSQTVVDKIDFNNIIYNNEPIPSDVKLVFYLYLGDEDITNDANSKYHLDFNQQTGALKTISGYEINLTNLSIRMRNDSTSHVELQGTTNTFSITIKSSPFPIWIPIVASLAVIGLIAGSGFGIYKLKNKKK